MPVVMRRVFYGKVGAAEDLVVWAQDMYGIINRYAETLSYRVLSDNQSGRTDRVVVEVEVESLADLEAALEKTLADSQGQADFAATFARLQGLIEYAEVEQWTVH